MNGSFFFIHASLLIILIFPQKGIAQDNLLWKVSGGGLEQPSWLFGTIHQICKEDLVFGKEAEAALERSQVVCFENDFTAFENPEAAKVIEETAPLPQDYLSVEDYAEVRDFMRSRFNIDSGEFSKMKLIQIYTTLNEKALGCDSVVSTEYYLLQKAKANGQTIKGLESAGRAMAVLNESHAKRIALQKKP